MQCFAGSIFPDSSLLSRGWSVGHGCTHLDLFMCSVAQNDPKLSQIIKNTSIATVTGTMNFCCLSVTLFQPLIAQCQIKHSRCIRLILFNLDSSQFVCGIPLLFFICLSFLLKNLMALLSYYILNVVRLCKAAFTIVVGLPPLPENLDKYYQVLSD